MERRKFLAWVGVGTLASSLPFAIAACRRDEPTQTTEQPSAEEDTTIGLAEFHSIGTVEELDAKGSLVSEEYFAIVARDPESDEPIAVSSVCTHRGCIVEWMPEEGIFVCPCHGSKYSKTGEVLAKPAGLPLERYETQIDGDMILVKTP